MIEWIEQHREILGWLAGGVATAAGGIWVVVRYFLERTNKSPPGSPEFGSPNRWQPSHGSAPSEEGSGQGSGTTVSTGAGIAAAGNVRVGGNVTIQQQKPFPKGAIVLAAVGLLLLGYAAFNSGSRVSVNNGSAVGGNVTNSTITVTPSR
jgi:hypothetical protein